MMQRMKAGLTALNRFADRHRVVLGVVLAALLSILLALHNVSAGPLRNLNDIGGWSNRALFIAMCAAVQAAVLVLCTLLCTRGFAWLALRQLLLTAGLYILLLAINQKSYMYVQVLQPLIRAMDAGGLAAGAAMEPNLSAPMLLLVYLMTRGPVYDLYLLKLFAIACYLVLALLAVYLADRKGLGLRADVLLALLMILPQGFMNAAFTALPELAAVMLLGISLTLGFAAQRPKPLAAALTYGAACALSGAALYALPAYIWLARRGRMKGGQLLAGVGLTLALCLPAMLCGMPVLRALGSLLLANLHPAAYASGAPGLMNLVPRALVEEMPQYAPVLRHFEVLDTVTNAQPYYTQAHFEQMSAGFIWVGPALYMGVCAWVWRAANRTPLHRVMTLVLGALLACPNVTSAAWLALDVLCLYAILAAPELRLPACMVLFATACSSCYPMIEEVMLPMVYAFVLCLLALCMLMGVIPMEKKAMGREEGHA